MKWLVSVSMVLCQFKKILSATMTIKKSSSAILSQKIYKKMTGIKIVESKEISICRCNDLKDSMLKQKNKNR
jgi:hypothetical protein